MSTASKTTLKSFSTEMSSQTCSWEISDDIILPALPFLYPLEKTHVLITNTAPSLVVSRLTKCLKELSISVKFSEEQFNIAKAETDDHTTFNIQLFSKLLGGDNEAIIVEVQRSSGCPISFHHRCQSILRAVRGLPYMNNNKRILSKSRPSLLQPPKSQKKTHPVDVSNNIQSSIEISCSLLKKDRFDANLLGIQSLRMLTDPETSGYQAAITVANIVLTGDEDNDDLMEIIKSLIKFWRLREDDLEEEEEEFDHKHFSQMHSHALAILANSLKLSAHCGKLPKVLEKFCWLSDDLVSLLLEEMSCTSSRPHDAFLAAKCLNVLVETSSSARSRAIDKGAEQAVRKSFLFGQCAHEMLAAESEKVLTALGH